MKTVFTNAMLTHVWAQRSQPYGRSKNGQISFDGAALISYSTPIANFMANKHGEWACVITTQSYSITTSSKHMPSYRDIAGCVVFRAKFVGKVGGRAPDGVSYRHGDNENNEFIHKANMDSYAEQYAELGLKAGRAKQRKEWLMGEMISLAAEADRYAKFYDVPLDETKFIPPSAEELARIKEANRLETLAKAEETKRRNAEKAAQIEDAIKAYIGGDIEALPSMWQYSVSKDQKARLWPVMADNWRNGRIYRLDSMFSETLMRIDGENIRTSRNAEFPVSHAVKAWPIIKRIMTSGNDWHKNGETIRLGHFQIDTAESGEKTFHAGCHVVSFSEVSLIANKLGLN